MKDNKTQTAKNKEPRKRLNVDRQVHIRICLLWNRCIDSGYYTYKEYDKFMLDIVRFGFAAINKINNETLNEADLMNPHNQLVAINENVMDN